MLPSTVDRVALHSPASANEKIESQLAARIRHYANATTEEITDRLHQLDYEWDIERLLEANAASVSLIGLSLGATVSRRWYLLPMFVAGFLLQHAVQGWCPPLVVMRRLGVRTSREIEIERHALKALRGDFQEMHRLPAEPGQMGERALDAARK